MSINNWDQVATEYKHLKSEEGDICRKCIIFPVLDDLLKDYKKGTALDIGCGTGLFTNRLTRQGFSAVGSDFSKEMISYARKTYSDSKGFYAHDLGEKFKESDDSIDLVTSILVFQDISDETFEKALPEINRVLSPDGVLLAVIPHPNFIDEFGNLINHFPGSYLSHHKATYIWKNGKTIATDFYLRPLSYYLNTLINAGLKIRKVLEPNVPISYKDHFPGEFDRKKEIPGFLILECVK